MNDPGSRRQASEPSLVVGIGAGAGGARSLDGGFHAHLLKPVDIDELEAVLGEALERSRHHDGGFR